MALVAILWAGLLIRGLFVGDLPLGALTVSRDRQPTLFWFFCICYTLMAALSVRLALSFH
jgi:hypothetical protein